MLILQKSHPHLQGQTIYKRVPPTKRHLEKRSPLKKRSLFL